MELLDVFDPSTQGEPDFKVTLGHAQEFSLPSHTRRQRLGKGSSTSRELFIVAFHL